MLCVCFFFNDTATTEIYTLSLHDALPIWSSSGPASRPAREWPWTSAPGSSGSQGAPAPSAWDWPQASQVRSGRSEEHTSELQSRQYLVCRLLLEKKKQNSSDKEMVLHTSR